jgi:hypothetical protein
MQGDGVGVVHPENVPTSCIVAQRSDEATRRGNALLRAYARYLPVSDSGDRVITSGQTQQGARCTTKLAMVVEQENLGVHLVDDHERQAAIVA